MKTSFKKRLCNKCKEQGLIWYQNKWWCAQYSEMGNFNMKGYCQHETTIDNNAK